MSATPPNLLHTSGVQRNSAARNGLGIGSIAAHLWCAAGSRALTIAAESHGRQTSSRRRKSAAHQRCAATTPMNKPFFAVKPHCTPEVRSKGTANVGI
jgi:hypothetical protein